MIIMEEYISPEEVAQKAHLHVDTVKRLLRRGEMPGYKIGNQWRIKLSELDAWLQERKNRNPEIK